MRPATCAQGRSPSSVAPCQHGVVHGDVKPANLLFRDAGEDAELVLGDFGLAQLADGTAPADRAARGTLAYMAPEQRRGDAGPKVDLYAAGVMLFEMLTGRTPWPREIIIAGLRKRGDVQLPDAVMRLAPPRVMTAIQDHLYELGDPDPAARPSTSDALDAALRLRAIAIGAGLPL